MSASTTQFSACALAAASAPPTQGGQTISQTGGMPARGQEHRRHGDDQQLLDDARLGEPEVGVHGVAATTARRPGSGRRRSRWDTGTLTGNLARMWWDAFWRTFYSLSMLAGGMPAAASG